MECTKLWDDYQNGMSYQSNMGFSKNIPEYVRFYEGQQWAPATALTKNLPRPVVNIIKMICRSKKSSILSSPVKITYKAEYGDQGMDVYNAFASYIQKEIGQESIDKRAIDDGVKKGTYIYHYYWDAEAKGRDGIKEGGLRCEIIDPLNIFFSDPTQSDEQKQRWIMISSREEIASVKAKADKDCMVDAITADDDDSAYNIKEQDGTDLCTVLTRYFRKDGEVYCEKATKYVIVNKPFRISPDAEKAYKMISDSSDDGKADSRPEDPANNSLPDSGEGEELTNDFVRAHLYPIVVGNYEPRNNSIFGIGEVEGLIPNQKAINFNIAMALLNVQENAWGKYIVLPGALNGQVIKNEPGQILIDYTNTGTGIKKMTEQTLQQMPVNLSDSLMQMTRSVTGANEVMSGEVLGSNMSGAAIAQLQSQAQMPIEELRDTFWHVKEKQGRIFAQFFRLYYTFDKPFPMEIDNGGQKEIQQAIFNGANYGNEEFEVVVEATAGTNASTAGDINALDVLLQRQLISTETYIQAYPDDALSNKSELLKAVASERMNREQQMAMQLKQYEEQALKSSEMIKQMSDTVNQVVSVIQENNTLRAMVASLYTEAKAKIEAGNQQLEEVTKDAQEFAQIIANNGIGSTAPTL